VNKKALLSTLFTVCLAASMMNVNAAGYQDNPWHFTLFTGRASLDSDRPTDNGSLYLGAGLGRWLTPNFSLDLEYDKIKADTDPAAIEALITGATFSEWNMSSFNFIGRYYFSGLGGAKPFLAFGPGWTHHRSIYSENSDFNFNLGAGIGGDITEHLSGRFQVMYRYNHDNNSLMPVNVLGVDEDAFDDLLFSLGITANWGGGGGVAPEPVVEPAAPESDADSDGDGVPDSRDRCPNSPAGSAVDQYGCPVDSDGDGVPNSRDKCPDSRPGAVVDLNGCEVEAVIDLRGVYFDFDRATLKPEAIAILDEAAELLNHHTKVVVEVAGHTDSIGSEGYNQGLSERRANVVRDYLTGKGVNASRMTAVGYGESRPVASNDTDEGRAENRRTELVVLER